MTVSVQRDTFVASTLEWLGPDARDVSIADGAARAVPATQEPTPVLAAVKAPRHGAAPVGCGLDRGCAPEHIGLCRRHDRSVQGQWLAVISPPCRTHAQTTVTSVMTTR